ncbi:MAG: ABC transporter ATP-binding protein [Pirellulales bacterium]|nr:ABC transporter ATP-binding protein [Pirellulales bacterium]
MNSAAVEVESLTKVYRDGWFGRRSVTALREVSFSVAPGTIFGLLGPNGAGKTTLIKVLLGLVSKSGGAASMMGLSAGDRRGRALVGYLPENHRIPRHLTGNSALTYYGGLSGLSPAEVRRRRGALLEQVGLAAWGKMSVKKYSKGMLQRLGLAQALLHDPRLLVLDEPTDGVDPVGRSEMRAILQNLKAQGKTIFINSHLLQEVELVCDRVAILVGGRLQRIGLVEEITALQKPDVQFTVAGDDQLVRDAFVDATVLAWSSDAAGRTRVALKSPEQSTVNACIDRLRASGVDVVAVTRARHSLEDVFLEVVHAAPKSSDHPGTL